MKRTFQIQNLKCSGCKNTIIDALLKISGVQNIAISVEDSSVSLTYKNSEVFENACVKLSQIGYPLAGEENNLLKKASSYVSCAIGKINNN